MLISEVFTLTCKRLNSHSIGDSLFTSHKKFIVFDSSITWYTLILQRRIHTTWEGCA